VSRYPEGGGGARSSGSHEGLAQKQGEPPVAATGSGVVAGG